MTKPKSRLATCMFMLIAGSAVAQNEPGHSAQWCSADIKLDGAEWKVYSATFRNITPDRAPNARKEIDYANEWQEMLEAKYGIRDWIPHSCSSHVLDWNTGDAQPFTTENGALAAANKKRGSYRDYKYGGKPRYAGVIDLDWLPSGTERMGPSSGEKRTPNPDLSKR